MKTLTVVGILLILIGIAALAYQGITYTRKEKIADIGPIEITKEEKKNVPLSPVLGISVLGAGIILLFLGAKQK